MTNHSYFNLTGNAGTHDVLGHRVRLYAVRFLSLSCYACAGAVTISFLQSPFSPVPPLSTFSCFLLVLLSFGVILSSSFSLLPVFFFFPALCCLHLLFPLLSSLCLKRSSFPSLHLFSACFLSPVAFPLLWSFCLPFFLLFFSFLCCSFICC